MLESLISCFAVFLVHWSEKKKFTADAAHELKTPLAALKIQVEVVIRETDGKKRALIFDKIIVGSNRCAHIVNQLLTLSRLEPEAKLINTEKINLNAVCRQMVALLASDALAKDIDIEFSAAKNDIFLAGNTTSMEILLRNLINNAIHYHQGGGKIKVALSERHHKILLQVIDDGPGVPIDQQKRIFDRFYRQVGQQVEGSGLGLSIVSHIVRLHGGGMIQAKTPNNGKGLEMRVVFHKS